MSDSFESDFSVEEEPALPGLPTEMDEEPEQESEPALPSLIPPSQASDQQVAIQPPPEDGKSWERPWTFVELRSWNKWTLACDSGLLNTLSQLSDNISRTSKDISASVEDLADLTRVADVRLNNAFNAFLNLASHQYVENSVYESDDRKKPTTEAAPEADPVTVVVPKFNEAISYAMQALEKTVVVDDLTALPEGVRPGASKLDRWAKRPLPVIIDSTEFHQDDFVGLHYEDEVDDTVEMMPVALAGEEPAPNPNPGAAIEESKAVVDEGGMFGGPDDDAPMKKGTAKAPAKRQNPLEAGMFGDEEDLSDEKDALQTEFSDEEEKKTTSTSSTTKKVAAKEPEKKKSGRPTRIVKKKVMKKVKVKRMVKRPKEKKKKEAKPKKEKKVRDADDLFGDSSDDVESDDAYGALFSDEEDGGAASEEEVEEEFEEEREVEVETEEEVTEEEVVEQEAEQEAGEGEDADGPPIPSHDEPAGGLQSDLMKALQAKLMAKGGPGLKKPQAKSAFSEEEEANASESEPPAPKTVAPKTAPQAKPAQAARGGKRGAPAPIQPKEEEEEENEPAPQPAKTAIPAPKKAPTSSSAAVWSSDEEGEESVPQAKAKAPVKSAVPAPVAAKPKPALSAWSDEEGEEEEANAAPVTAKPKSPIPPPVQKPAPKVSSAWSDEEEEEAKPAVSTAPLKSPIPAPVQKPAPKVSDAWSDEEEEQSQKPVPTIVVAPKPTAPTATKPVPKKSFSAWSDEEEEPVVASKPVKSPIPPPVQKPAPKVSSAWSDEEEGEAQVPVIKTTPAPTKSATPVQSRDTFDWDEPEEKASAVSKPAPTSAANTSAPPVAHSKLPAGSMIANLQSKINFNPNMLRGGRRPSRKRDTAEEEAVGGGEEAASTQAAPVTEPTPPVSVSLSNEWDLPDDQSGANSSFSSLPSVTAKPFAPSSTKPANAKIAGLAGMLNFNPAMLSGGPRPEKVQSAPKADDVPEPGTGAGELVKGQRRAKGPRGKKPPTKMDAKPLVVQLDPEESTSFATTSTNTNTNSNSSLSTATAKPASSASLPFDDVDDTDFPSFAALKPTATPPVSHAKSATASASKPGAFVSVFDEDDDIFGGGPLLPAAKPKPVEATPAPIVTPTPTVKPVTTPLTTAPVTQPSPLAQPVLVPTVTSPAPTPKKVFDFEDDIFNIPQLKPKSAVNVSASIDSIFPDAIIPTASKPASSVTSTASPSATTKKAFDFDDDIFKIAPLKPRDASASIDSMFPTTTATGTASASSTGPSTVTASPSTGTTAKKPAFDFDDDIFNSVLASSKPKPKPTFNTDDIFSQ